MSKSRPNWAQMEGTFQIAQLIIIILSVSTYQFNEASGSTICGQSQFTAARSDTNKLKS